jgi:NADP-dependent 3-hydroxy acid dehydrogenase YdfG
LSGQTALVTGASAGIGRASAVALAQAGAKVVATGRRKAELDALAKECGKNAVEPVVGDINDAGFVADLARRAGAQEPSLGAVPGRAHGAGHGGGAEHARPADRTAGKFPARSIPRS